MKIIAFVPVRGGSKSIPLKNIKLFCGKPLVYWSLKALQNVDDIDEIFVATDSERIANTVTDFCFSKVKIYKRSSENAQDHSSTESVMLEFIGNHMYSEDDIFILVQATMPLLTSDDVRNGLRNRVKCGADSLLSCARIKMFFWDESGFSINYDFKNRPRRQDFRGDLMENGSFYINTFGNVIKYRNRLSGKVAIYEMGSYTSVDIDEEDDWIIAEKLMYRHILQKAPKPDIKMMFTDVDGTLTDSGMYYGKSGEELKKFNTRDGKGFELLRKQGIITGIITSERTEIVEKRAQKLKIDHLFQGVNDKLEALNKLCNQLNFSLNEIAYIGDDVNDIELLSNVGLAACPADSSFQVKQLPGIIVLNNKGGQGAVREFIDNHIIQRLT